MIKNDILKVTSESGNTYSLLLDTGIILTQEGLNNSSEKRKELLLKFNHQYQYTTEKHDPIDASSIRETILQHCLSECILEMTTNCNMRCKYCIFGENYSELRTRGFEEMSFETAQKAIDYYLSLIIEGRPYNPDRIPFFAFYGGEPLLNFSLIQKCMDYIESVYDGIVYYTLTTNATVLTDTMIDYFYGSKNRIFIPIISIDGPKCEHDRNRILGSGSGSFDTVLKNVNRLYKARNLPLFVNAVYDYGTDLERVIDYFAQSEQLQVINFSPVSPAHTSYYDKYTESDKKRFNSSLLKLRTEYLSLIANFQNRHDIPKPLSKRFALLDLLFSKQCLNILLINSNLTAKKEILNYTGTCIPGERLFVDVNGKFYPCEKLSRSRNIGNVQSGLDFNLIASYMNEYNEHICSHCCSCDVRKYCGLCFNNFLENGQFVFDKKQCNSSRFQLIESFEAYCTICEANKMWMERFRAKYYSTIKELMVTMR